MDTSSTCNSSCCAFTETHRLTSNWTTGNSFRFVTYNVLADLYAFRDIDDYTPYCKPEHLDFDYRQHLLVKEIIGYHGDIICLQEVDVKAFTGNLTRELKSEGLEGIYLNKRGKRGELTEGSALFYRKSKFKLIEQHGQSIVHVLENESFCEDVKDWAYSNTSWRKSIENQAHTVQIAVLELTEQPGEMVIVCNTHLLWDESNPHVRYVQILVAIRVLEHFMEIYKHKEPRIIYCGDFNTRPEEHMIQFILQNDPSFMPRTESKPDINTVICGTATVNFSHSLTFGNACGFRPYTCLTKIFRGHLDYIFYDRDLLEVTKVIPQLDDAIVTRHTALPNVEIITICPHVYYFRFVTYNVLADLYAFRDIDDYTPYCKPEHLDFDYRQHLLVKEIIGYHGDIICLQEVDVKAFTGNLTRELKSEGLEGIYLNKRGKRGELTEGSALFYRKSKFKLIEQHGQSIVHVLENESFCEDVKDWAYSNTSWRKSIENQAHTVQIAVLELTEQPGEMVIVCNTHLLWDESNPHVRYVQILVAIRVLEHFMEIYKHKEPRIIYCGDFNTRPEEHMIQFILQNDPSFMPRTESKPDINTVICGTATVNFSHSLTFGNACGFRPYTCLTKIFRGHLDYIFYDRDLLEVTKVIPQLDDAIVTRHTALPNVEIPSDHLAQICEFKFKTLSLSSPPSS